MKIHLCCTSAYYLVAAFTIIDQIGEILGQFHSLEHGSDSSSSNNVNEKTCEARLDRVERKVEFQDQAIAILTQDHKELKAMYWTLKRKQKPREDPDEKDIKMNSATTALSQIVDNSYSQLRNKRPVRLLPASILRGRKNTTDEVFNDPPTNCRDLGEIGHTLNGYYAVQLKLIDGEKKSDKIGMIYCKFNSDKIVERKVGLLTVKSSPIYFYVMRSTPFNKENQVIRPYEIELLNQGGAMNRTSGVFKAPVNGIYHFSFRGHIHTQTLMHMNYIHLRKNGSIVATSITNTGVWKFLTLECTLRLKKYDHIDLKKGPNKGELAGDTPDKEHLSHFSGHLLEEDLTL